MLTDNQADIALRRMADEFLNDIREIDAHRAGWGQFVDQRNATQVGLYGTCSGIIVVALAYGAATVPAGGVEYLRSLWAARADTNTSGPRYFALTLRLAFFVLALRASRLPALLALLPEVEAELVQRRSADGLFLDWWIDANTNSTTGREYTTAIVLLAYGLTKSAAVAEPEFVRNTAEAMQKSIAGALNPDVTSRKLYLAAVGMTLPKAQISREVKNRIRSEYRARAEVLSEYLYFWDYRFTGAQGQQSKRDFFYILPEVVDVLMAATEVAGPMQKLSGIEILQKFRGVIAQSPSGSFYRHGLASSKDQAWIALAFRQLASLKSADTRWARMRFAAYSGSPESWAWSLVFPVLALAIFGTLASAPDTILGLLRHSGLVASQPPSPGWWDSFAKPALTAMGLIMLTVTGEKLWKRLSAFVRSRLP